MPESPTTAPADVAATPEVAASAFTPTPSALAEQRSWPKPPEMTINPESVYVATMETEKGDIVLELFADKAPMTVNNFVFLAEQGFYDNTTFHRVLDGFMAQGGDPTGTGMGGPGYEFADEIDPTMSFDHPRHSGDGQ